MFTAGHAVAVLPLATGRPGRELWPAALVIGSMVPALPYFLPPHRGSKWSHAASGPVTIDLALGLLVFALWVLVLRRPLVDLAPRWLADRLPPPRSLSAVGWVQAGVSVVIGALTHVWDSFTHPRRWGTDHLTTLNRGLGPMPAYQWLPYGGGVLGLLALAVWTVVWLRGRQPRSISHRWAVEARTRTWVSVAAAFVGAGAGYWDRPSWPAGRSTSRWSFARSPEPSRSPGLRCSPSACCGRPGGCSAQTTRLSESARRMAARLTGPAVGRAMIRSEGGRGGQQLGTPVGQDRDRFGGQHLIAQPGRAAEQDLCDRAGTCSRSLTCGCAEGGGELGETLLPQDPTPAGQV